LPNEVWWIPKQSDTNNDWKVILSEDKAMLSLKKVHSSTTQIISKEVKWCKKSIKMIIHTNVSLQIRLK